MKQVFISGQGQIDIIDVPIPSLLSGGILVHNAYSLISAGTEGAAVTKHSGVQGLYEKALNSRDKMGQVWAMVQGQGMSNTLKLIRDKLNDYSPIGYSCAGVVLETDKDDLGFKPDQRVACMGTGFANHAEYVVVPKNLAVPLSDNVNFDEAAFAAIACIAMQGIRRLELSPGERVGVIGLGLIGQIALRLATVMGYQAYGFDISDHRVAKAARHSQASLVVNSASTDPVSVAMEASHGNGLDGIVICASGKADSVINQAFMLCRKRGRVSVVGDIGLELERAKMYSKELEVRLSCSYGVGRYDPDYELGGRDYPLPHVRWTERRNLEFFIHLLAEKRLDLGDLVSAKIGIEDAKKAYSLIKAGNSDVYGVLLDYHLPPQPQLPQHAFICRYDTNTLAQDKKCLQIGLIGVGGYAKNVHVPNIQKLENVIIRALSSKSGATAAVVAKKVKAAYATSDISEMLSDKQLDAVVISTRHASHAKLVLAALSAGKHVFVEKPMAITLADCLQIVSLQQETGLVLRVGFNRRFSPYLQEMKRAVGIGRKLFNVRVNVGQVGNHWSNTVEEGGRLLGEGVHFFDLANWMMDCNPVTVSAQFLGEVNVLNPNASVTIRYEDGSIANVVYTTVGHTGLGKEHFELFGNGRSIVMDDYKMIKSFGCGVAAPRKYKKNKGQHGAILEFSRAIKNGDGGGGANAVAGLWATAITEAALKSAETNRTIDMAFIFNTTKQVSAIL
ncbi:Gfo/Idh/MocA family oxidoreductase [Syntrophus aciditrophicus]|uniref:Zinc-binding dehydrogenase n=1 Tax=Syntrophus aciditrophicus (strain SB) TaxID=56780 RepID=Q2LWM5_SYNAS|nr:Gfo/Idh/MocA family oxidoreductase [Syntrophus aciditrophicus]ABC78482.1 zinc-binding dehydrogenase [Syntrophus aciditrophicus SB]